MKLLEMMYKTVVVPEAVYRELTSNDRFEGERETIANCTFISIAKVYNTETVSILQDVIGLDAGESESLVLYGEKNADLLLMDERKGRGVAKKMSVRHVGTVGVLMQAFDECLISAEEVHEILKIMLMRDIRLSRKLCDKVLNYVGLESCF